MLRNFKSNPNRLSRRAVIGSVAAVGLSAGTAAHAHPTRPPTLPPLATTAAPATTAQELVAVRVFPTYATEVYGQHDAVLARLGELGVKRMSHKMGAMMSAATISFTQRAYQQHGIKSWLTVGESRVPLTAAQWDTIVALLKGPLAGMVDRCYGWNEPNHGRGGAAFTADWPTMTAAHQTQLWQRVAPLGIKVGTPQLWSADFATHDADLAKLAPLITGTFDHIGWHLYPRGGVGVEYLEQFEATYRRVLGEFPVVCTETGYSTVPNYSGGAQNVTEAEQATLLPQLVDSYVSRGYGLSVFELLDDPDPTGGNREAHLGLVRTPTLDPATWTNKPAFGAFNAKLASI